MRQALSTFRVWNGSADSELAGLGPRRQGKRNFRNGRVWADSIAGKQTLRGSNCN